MTEKEKLIQARKKVNVNPSEAQKEAGNYAMGHVNLLGFDITIENPKGSYRRGHDRNGKEWKTYMYYDYGYFTKTLGYDGDAVDVFIGNNLKSDKIFAVDQFINGKFDETKFLIGFNDKEQAKKGYLSCYDKDWKGFKEITEIGIDDFKKWLYDGKQQRKPFYQYKSLKDKFINEDYSSDYKLIANLLEKGYIVHGTNADFEQFDSKFIKGGSRAREGYGFYFTEHIYKPLEYGETFFVVKKNDFTFLPMLTPIDENSELYHLIFDSYNRKQREISRLEDKLYYVRNNREYDEINDTIESIKSELSKYDNRLLMVIRYSIINLKVKNVGVLQETIPSNYIKPLTELFLTIGYDGYSYDGIYTIFNFDKLNKLTKKIDKTNSALNENHKKTVYLTETQIKYIRETLNNNIKNLNESARNNKYVNMNVELRKGGRNAVKMSVEDFQYEFNHFVKEWYIEQDEYPNHFGKKADVGRLYSICNPWVKNDKHKVGKELNDDVWGGKYKFDGENHDSRGGIKLSSKGVPYIECYAGGDWESPVCFFVYFDGNHFRGYVPLKGNTICRDNNQAFGNDYEGEDSTEIKFLKKEFGVKTRDELPIQVTDLDYNVDACLEDFMSRIEIKGTYKKRDYTKDDERFDEFKKRKDEEKKQRDAEREAEKQKLINENKDYNFYTVPLVHYNGVDYTKRVGIPFIYDYQQIHYLERGEDHYDDKNSNLTNKEYIAGRIFILNDENIIICMDKGLDYTLIKKPLLLNLVKQVVEHYNFNPDNVYYVDTEDEENTHNPTPLTPKTKDSLIQRKRELSKRRGDELEAKYRFRTTMDESKENKPLIDGIPDDMEQPFKELKSFKRKVVKKGDNIEILYLFGKNGLGLTSELEKIGDDIKKLSKEYFLFLDYEPHFDTMDDIYDMKFVGQKLSDEDKEQSKYNERMFEQLNKYRNAVLLNESKRKKKIVRNDEGEIVPDICPECGSEVGLYIQGEPIYRCSNDKCKKYFGTMPFNLKN